MTGGRRILDSAAGGGSSSRPVPARDEIFDNSDFILTPDQVPKLFPITLTLAQLSSKDSIRGHSADSSILGFLCSKSQFLLNFPFVGSLQYRIGIESSFCNDLLENFVVGYV